MITLSRRLDVESALLHGSVSFYRRIRYIIPVLMRVREENGSTRQSVSDHLCVDSDIICGRILERCAEEGLVERDGDAYRITGEGDDAISEGLVPETVCGTFLVHYASHPLLGPGHKILLILRADWEAKNRNQQIIRSEDPDIFGGSRVRTLLGEKSKIRMTGVDSLDVFKTSAEGRITWSLGRTESKVAVEFRHGEREQNIERCGIDPPDAEYGAVWDELLEKSGRNGDWDAGNDRLLVRHRDTDAGERRTMKKTIKIEEGEIDGFGRYDGFDVRVDIYPADQESAREWARDLLADGVNGYVTARRFEDLKKSVAARLPEYEMGFGDRSYYADYVRFKWHILAMEDWDL